TLRLASSRSDRGFHTLGYRLRKALPRKPVDTTPCVGGCAFPMAGCCPRGRLQAPARYEMARMDLSVLFDSRKRFVRNVSAIGLLRMLAHQRIRVLKDRNWRNRGDATSRLLH